MAILRVQARPGVVRRWEVAPWAVDSAAFVLAATLAPTAVLPGCWVIWGTADSAHVFSVKVSSTVAIGIHFANISANPGLAAATARCLDHTAQATGMTCEAAVAAAPAHVDGYGAYTVPANDVRELMDPVIQRIKAATGLLIYTDLVAATVTVAISWMETTD